ncbi:MAG: ROK family protein, partial [Eubacteriales bacterium]|nr:ROK family protein [Eubacteriales bacterium]
NGFAEAKTAGRKAALIGLNYDAMHVAAVDIGSKEINIALCNLKGEIKDSTVIPADTSAKGQKILQLTAENISLLTEGRLKIGEGRLKSGEGRLKSGEGRLKSGEGRLKNDRKSKKPAIVAVGVALSGIIQDDEKLLLSTSLKWKDISIKKYFEDNLQIPCFVQNDSVTKAMYAINRETEDKSRYRNIIFLDLDMGVGAISIYDNKINEAVTGEFGHTTVKKDGPACFCGNNGCLEVMCSVESIIGRCAEMLAENKCRILRDILKEKGCDKAGSDACRPDYNTVIEAFDRGDKDVKDILKECGEYLGIGMANLINMFNPDKIIINGDMLIKSDYIYNIVLRETKKRAYELFAEGVVYERVNIGMKESMSGLTRFITEKLFSLTGEKIF